MSGGDTNYAMRNDGHPANVDKSRPGESRDTLSAIGVPHPYPNDEMDWDRKDGLYKKSGSNESAPVSNKNTEY